MLIYYGSHKQKTIYLYTDDIQMQRNDAYESIAELRQQQARGGGRGRGGGGRNPFPASNDPMYIVTHSCDAYASARNQ